MKYIKNKWGLALFLVIVLTLAIASPALADDGGPTSAQVNDLTLGLNILWLLLGGFLVFFMQAGFLLGETRFTHNKNVAHTMMNNMVVVFLGGVGYLLTGFVLAACA